MIVVPTNVSWCCSGQFDWNSRQWADGSLLYNQNSGDTHYLDPLTRRIADLLETNCFNIEEIRAALVSQPEEAIVIPNSKFALNTLIADLERIGLIEVAS